MFKNLLDEFSKNQIEIDYVAKELNISTYEFEQKLQGVCDFKLDECLKIKQLISSETNLSLDYLFDK